MSGGGRDIDAVFSMVAQSGSVRNTNESEVGGSNPPHAILQYGGGLTRVISGWTSDICTRKVEGGERNGRDQCAVG